MSLLVYIDMDGVLCDFDGAFKRDKDAFPDLDYPQSREGFYRGLVPIEGAVECLSLIHI